MNHPPLKIALIVDSDIVPIYVQELVQWARQQDAVEMRQVIVQAVNKPARLQALPGQLLFKLITRLENRMLAGSALHKDHLRRCDIKADMPGLLTVHPDVSHCGREYRYTDDDASRIRALDLDLIIHCGSGTPRGELSDAAAFGLIALDYGWDPTGRNACPGEPPGFQEVHARKDATGFAIRQLNQPHGSDKVLMSGQFQTKFHYLLNQAALRKKSNAHLMKLVAQLAADRTLPVQGPAAGTFHNAPRAPGVAAQFSYGCSLARTVAGKVMTRLLLKRDYRWAFAFSRNNWTSLAMDCSNRVRNPPNHFLADPFVVREGNRDFCFVEDYDYSRKRGCIAVYELNGNNAEALGEAIVEPFHMSFPYLFRFGGKLYMCPETSENRDIRLYECVDFPLRWKLAKVLMENVSAVDTMIFERDGSWWMFTNIDSAEADDNSAELFLFFSDNPIEGVWKAHPRNPLFIDPSRARNAGLLFDGDAIYRVAQRQAFDMYGYGFSINRISMLDKERYGETELRSVKPNFFANLKGTHHLHSNGFVSVFDYVKLTSVSN